jgi:hypothetical protein
MMAVAGLRIRLWLETRDLGFQYVIRIVIGAVGAVGLLLADLLAGALRSPHDPPRHRYR